MSTQNVLNERVLTFECESDRLIGVLHEPDARTQADIGVLVVVGGPQYRVGSHRQFVLMARAFAQAGYPVLRFDYRGMGDSEGAPRQFDAASADIRTGVDALLAARPELRGVVLWGLCDGASAALMYCRGDARVLGLALANPWVYTQTAEAQSYIRHYYFGRLLQRTFWTKLLSFKLDVRGSLSDFTRKLVASRREQTGASGGGGFIARMRSGLQSFDRPVLFLLSERDLTARQFQDLIEAPGEWRRAMKRDNVEVEHVAADHTFSNRDGLDAATKRCLQWLDELARAAQGSAVAPRLASAHR